MEHNSKIVSQLFKVCHCVLDKWKLLHKTIWFPFFVTGSLVKLAVGTIKRKSTVAHVLKRNPQLWINCIAYTVSQLMNFFFCIITLMIIENRALWLTRGFASSGYNHHAVIITLKASSFQNGSLICWCFGVRNWSIILFSRIIINIIILKLVTWGKLNIGKYSPRLRLGDYSPIFMLPSASNC